MTTKKQLIIGLSLFLFTIINVYAQPIPTLPTILQGELTINDNPAPIGTKITSFVDDIKVGNINTTKEGLYIISVSGNTNNEGKQITLFVNDINAKINTTWASGKVETINLAVTKNNNYLYAIIAAITTLIVFFALKPKKKPKK